MCSVLFCVLVLLIGFALFMMTLVVKMFHLVLALLDLLVSLEWGFQLRQNNVEKGNKMRKKREGSCLRWAFEFLTEFLYLWTISTL